MVAFDAQQIHKSEIRQHGMVINVFKICPVRQQVLLPVFLFAAILHSNSCLTGDPGIQGRPVTQQGCKRKIISAKQAEYQSQVLPKSRTCRYGDHAVNVRIAQQNPLGTLEYQHVYFRLGPRQTQ